MGDQNNNPTLTLFPQMLQKTKLLILDYDVTRYHSFDLFRWVLLDREMFMSLKPELHQFVKYSDSMDQLWWFIRNNRNINIYDNFTSTKNKIDLTEYENRLNTAMRADNMIITQTDITKRFSVVFNKNSVETFWLKYKHDMNHIIGEDDIQKIYTTDRVLDLRMAVAVIQKEVINAVMVANSELMILLIKKLREVGYTNQISFMLGTYAYNYDPRSGIMRNISLINKLEYLYKYEFGVFDPFTGLHTERKERPK